MSNASQAWLRQDAMVGGDHKWLAGGDWTIEHYASLAKSVSAARISHAEGYATPLLDWTQVQRLDTAGAALLVEILGPDSILDRPEAAPNLSPDRSCQPLPSPSSTTHATPNARCSTKR